MSNTNTGGPAFPACDAARIHNIQGMTLRDYFAAKAMGGFCSDPMLIGAIGRGSVTTDEVCNRAYGLADAMLKAREQ